MKPKHFIPVSCVVRAGLLTLAWLWFAGGAAFSAPMALEERDFTAARKVFEDKNYVTAERWFGDFVRQFTNSPKLPEAVLRQAQARYFLTNSAGAAQLLTTNLARAGERTDGYLFWLGEAHFQGSNFMAAAAAYGRVAREFTNSTHNLMASYNETLARHKLGDAARVVELLSQPEGAFQRAARLQPKDELVASGNLLLGETQLERKQFAGVQAALDALAETKLNAEMDWRRHFLECRLRLTENRAPQALLSVTNLLAAATAAGQAKFLAESFALAGEVHERLGNLGAAAQAWTNNLTPRTPPEYRRQALLQGIKLTLAQNQVTNTIAMLESFSAQYPRDSAMDVAQFTLGELRLKEYHAAGTNAAAGGANLLLQAVTNLTHVVTVFTNSALVGGAYFHRGWCFTHLGRVPESAADFAEAARRLPVSEDQARALFQLAESQSQLGEHTNAIVSLRELLAKYSTVAPIKATLLNPALYRLLRAGIAAGDLAVAGEAVGKIQTMFPTGEFADRSLLLYGHALDQQGRSADARTQFQEVLTRHPNSPLVPEAQLAVSRTFKQERNYKDAIARLDEWIGRHPTNALLPQVEFERAWLHFQAGNETNAVRLLTNFIARFPADTNAPLAQYWVGNYYHNQGEFVTAEEHYQRVFLNTNWPAGELKYQARLAAGQAAVQRQGFKAAVDYFLTIINDTACPAMFVGEAYFQLGQTYMESAQVNEGLTKEPWSEAITAFSRVVNTNSFPNHLRAALALARIGSCHLQLATKDPARYDLAAAAYQRAMDWPRADAATRSGAEIGLGVVLEKQNKPLDALERYLRVVYGKNLRADEAPDLDAVKNAGFNGARMLEDQQRWAEAVGLYDRLIELLPPLRETLEKKRDRALKNLRAAKN